MKRKISILISCIACITAMILLLSGCGKTEPLPVVENEVRAVDTNISGVQAVEDGNAAIGEPEHSDDQNLPEPAQDSCEITEPAGKKTEYTMSKLERFFSQNPEFAGDLVDAAGCDIHAAGNTIELVYDLTKADMMLKLKDMTPQLSDYVTICNQQLQASHNNFVFIQRYFTELLHEEIIVRVTFTIDNIVIVSDYFDNSTQPMGDLTYDSAS